MLPRAILEHPRIIGHIGGMISAEVRNTPSGNQCNNNVTIPKIKIFITVTSIRYKSLPDSARYLRKVCILRMAQLDEGKSG